MENRKYPEIFFKFELVNKNHLSELSPSLIREKNRIANRPLNHGLPIVREETELLKKMVDVGQSLEFIEFFFQRSKKSIAYMLENEKIVIQDKQKIELDDKQVYKENKKFSPDPNAAVLEVIKRAYDGDSTKSPISKKKSKKRRKTTKKSKIKFDSTNSKINKPKGQRSMVGPYGKSGGMKGLYPSQCPTCGNKLPAQYIVNCPKCTRSIL